MALDDTDHSHEFASDAPRVGVDRQSSWHPYHQISANIANGYMNLLLICVPLGICLAVFKLPPLIVFSLNLLAIPPLIAWITYAIGELYSPIGRMGVELLKATLGNPVEVLVSLVAISQGQILVVQRIVIGSILLNSLLVLGCCFFVAGIRQKRVQFDRTTTSIMSSLTIIVVISLMISTIMSIFPPTDENDSVRRDQSYIIRISHATAIVLFVLCLIFFYFEFYSHPNLFRVDATQSRVNENAETHPCHHDNPQSRAGLNRWVASLVLIVAIAAVVGCAHFLLLTVDEVARTVGVSSAFLVAVLVPVLGNASKTFTIVTIAKQNSVDLAVRAVIGTNLRLLILVMPALVLVGWIFEQPLTLQFDPFDATILFLAIMVMNYLTQDGRSNYFEGLVLMGTYAIILVAFEVRPMPPENVIYLSG